MVSEWFSEHGEPTTASEGQARQALARWVETRMGALAESATDRIWIEVPSYRASGLRSDVSQHVARVYGVFVSTVRESRDPSVQDFPWTAEHAERRVEHGISLVDFLKAFRIAQLELWDGLLGWSHERPGSGADLVVLGLVSHVMRTIESGSAAAAATYLEAQQFELADHEHIQRDLLEDLLAGRLPTQARRLTMLREAALADDQPFVVATALLEGEEDSGEQESLTRTARTHLSHATGGIHVLRQTELVALLPVRGQLERVVHQRLARAVDELAGRDLRLRLGLSGLRTDLSEVPDAYAEARLACESIERPHGVASLADLSALDYLVRRPDETVRRLIRPEVRDFLTEDLAGQGTYSASLQAFLDHDLNAREAAKALHVHVNTMYYRLERIASRTGCDLRRVDQMMELVLALRMLRADRSG